MYLHESDFFVDNPHPIVIRKLYTKVTNFLFPKYYKTHLHDVMMGLYFGYPTCCIKDYCSTTSSSTMSRIVGSYADFYPCNFHAKQVHDKEVTLEELLINRICVKPLGFIPGREFRKYEMKELIKWFNALHNVNKRDAEKTLLIT